MPDSHVQTIGGCRLSVDPSGIAGLYCGDLAAVRATPIEEETRETKVEETVDGIVTRSRGAGFVREATLSLRTVAGLRLLHVRTVATANRTGPFEGVVDRWNFVSPSAIDYRWSPNLRPGEDLRIGSHCFRSPVVMVSGNSGGIALIPDFAGAGARADAGLCSLDLRAESADTAMLGYGIEPTRPTGHVYFEVDRTAESEAGRRYRFDYYLMLLPDSRPAFLRKVCAFLWHHYASSYLGTDLPQTVPFDAYAGYAYPSVLSTPPFVTFDCDGRKAGGVRAEKAHADYFRRPEPVVWNQAWFNGQRAAYGMGAFGKRSGQDRWIEAGRLITATTLSAPDWAGLWPAIYAYEDRLWWGSIPRLNGGRRRVHVADAALTGEWLLRWISDVEDTPGAGGKLRALVDRLCAIQATDGSIPPWLDFDGSRLEPNPVLRQSAETGAAAVFLGEAARHEGFKQGATSVLRAADFLATEVMPAQRYQDFETFFSCSTKDLDMVDPFTGMLPQNSLAVYWTARTMLSAHRLSGRDEYLALASEATDILSLYQQVWNPPFLSLYAFGGFGVMNTDAEWNDARQSLFAPHYFAMYEATGLDEYLERGRAALRASFVLASIPENATVSPNTFDAYPLGLMPENYGHSGRDAPAGRSDTCWGESGALTGVAWLRTHYPALIKDLRVR